MRFLSLVAAWMMIFFYPIVLFAQEVAKEVAEVLPPVEVLPEIPNTSFVEFLVQSLGGVAGAGALGVAYIVVQILVKFLHTPWAGQVFKKLKGGEKFTIVLGLSMVAGVLALMLPPVGLTLGAALVHSTTLAAFGVFLNQAWKQWFVKKD